MVTVYEAYRQAYQIGEGTLDHQIIFGPLRNIIPCEKASPQHKKAVEIGLWHGYADQGRMTEAQVESLASI